ncbi:MAG: hypothetical protein ACE5G3_06260 [Gammaproteobacteria bacterium]
MNESAQTESLLTELERAVLEIALAPDTGDNARLRDQVGAATVASRTPSGVGFMTKLAVPEALALPARTHEDSLPRVIGSHPELPTGAEFILQVKAGRLNTIEAFCYEGMWPGDESLFRVQVGP